jgi:hypothetical protein
MARGRAAAMVLLLAAAGLSGCLGGGEPLVVAAAPITANGMTVAVVVPRGIFGGGDGTASFRIAYNGQTIYPPGGVLPAPIEIVEGKGSAFVDYRAFVVDNGDYAVTVEFQGHL